MRAVSMRKLLLIVFPPHCKARLSLNNYLNCITNSIRRDKLALGERASGECGGRLLCDVACACFCGRGEILIRPVERRVKSGTWICPSRSAWLGMEVAFGCAPLFSEGGYLTNHRGRTISCSRRCGRRGQFLCRRVPLYFVRNNNRRCVCGDVPGISLALLLPRRTAPGPFKIKTPSWLLLIVYICVCLERRHHQQPANLCSPALTAWWIAIWPNELMEPPRVCLFSPADWRALCIVEASARCWLFPKRI